MGTVVISAMSDVGEVEAAFRSRGEGLSRDFR